MYAIHALIAPPKWKGVEVLEESDDEDDVRAAVIDTGMFSVKVRDSTCVYNVL